jgi:hypothetical protein
MKKILLFLFSLFSLQTFAQNSPVMEMLIFPKYIEGPFGARGQTRSGVPYVYRARISHLIPSTTYRYENRIVTATTATPAAGETAYILPQGNVVLGTIGYNPGDFFMPERTSSTGSNGASELDVNYGEFKSDDQGTYTGWFIQETTSSVYEPVILRIALNDPSSSDLAKKVYYLHSPEDQPITVLNAQSKLNSEGAVHYATAIRSTAASAGKAKNFVVLYDNVEGTGRPVAATFIENDGVASTPGVGQQFGLAPFYYDHVNGVDGTWGTIIPNSDVNGIKRIEQFSLEDGTSVGYNISADGTWADGLNKGSKVATANVAIGAPVDGNTAIVIDGETVTLAPVKNPQTVAFTNTFQPVYNIGDVITLSASSSVGLTAFQYTATPTGILEITGNTAKVVGAGTAILTVTEPGNANTAAGTAQQSITVNGTPQAITGFPATLAGTYGDANLALAATGGASGNPVVYTSSDPTIAEITAGNQVVFKKGGTVTIKANQLGNTTYSPAPELSSTLTVAKAVLDVVAEDKFKTQGGANPEATFVFGAFKNSDDASSVAGTPVLTIQANANTPAGVYDIAVDVFSMTSEKYTFNPVNGKLTIIAKKDQVITFSNFSPTAVYGAQPLPFQVSSNTANGITFSSSNAAVAIVEKNAIGEWAITVKGAGEADITASQPEDAEYLAGTATQHISVAQAPLSIIAEDKAKLTGEADPEFTVRYEGFVNNEGAGSLTGAIVYTKQPDGVNISIVPSGVTSTNYAITFVNGTLTEGDVAFAPIHKTYGDPVFSPGARSTGGGTVTYVVADPTIAITNSAGLVQLRGAGSTEITATFSSGESPATTTLTVDKKMLTVIADAKTKVYAQPNPELSVEYTGFANNESSFVLTTPPTIVTTATETSPVAKYAITASGAVARNYTFNYFPGVLTVTPAALVVKADDVSRLYGAANPAFTLNYTGLAPQDNGADLNLQTVVSTTATPVNQVGNYPITVTGLAGTQNYTVTYAEGTLSVSPAPLNIKANDIDRAEGQPNPVFTFAYNGFVNNEGPADLSSAPVGTTTATQTSPKGVYPITVTGAASSNYAITYTEGQLSVKGLQTVAFNDMPAVSYGDADFTPVATSETGQAPVFSSDNLNVAVIESGRVKIIAAGTVNISATFPATANFVAVTVTKPLVIAKRTLIVRADSKTKLYGQANPALTASYEGFVKSETVATAVSAPAILTTNASPLSPVGTYSIAGSSASALNYTIVYEPGVLTVDKAVLRVTADNKTRAFGEANPELTFRYTGFVNAENESVIQIPAVASTPAGINSPAGSYPITLSGASDENYNFTYVDGALRIGTTTRAISMAPIPVKAVGDADFTPEITLTSGEIAVLTTSDAAIATVVDNKIHIVGAGNVTVTATAPDNVSYTGRPSTSQLLVVSKVAQTITFETVPSLKTGAAYTLKATSTSGLPVTFTVSDPARLSLSGNEIKANRIGKIQVTASQAGNNQYAAAKLVVQEVQVADADGTGLKVHPALSLNGDGINDFLTIDGIKDFPLNKVTIINRTGIKVFDLEGYDNDQHVFVGKTKSGALLPQGTYYCLVEYNVDSHVKRKTGYFILKY